MVEKAITKKYLQDRVSFKDKTVVGALDFNGLYAIVKQLTVAEQKAIFKITDKRTSPLNEDQIDALFPYLPSEVRQSIDFIDLTKKEKLDLVRENKDKLTKVIDKKGFNEQIDIDKTVTTPSEEYSSALLWDIIKAKANLS